MKGTKIDWQNEADKATDIEADQFAEAARKKVAWSVLADNRDDDDGDEWNEQD